MLSLVDQFDGINPQVKGALTKQYNEQAHASQALNYEVGVKKSKRAAAPSDGLGLGLEGEEEEEENEAPKEEEVDLSAFAKRKKPAAKKAAPAKKKPAAGAKRK